MKRKRINTSTLSYSTSLCKSENMKFRPSQEEMAKKLAYAQMKKENVLAVFTIALNNQ